MALSPELREYYENYLTMFRSPGWEQLKEEVIQHISTLEKTTLRQGDTETFQHNKGAVAALEYIINYHELVARTYEELENEDELDAAV